MIVAISNFSVKLIYIHTHIYIGSLDLQKHCQRNFCNSIALKRCVHKYNHISKFFFNLVFYIQDLFPICETSRLPIYFFMPATWLDSLSKPKHV